MNSKRKKTIIICIIILIATILIGLFFWRKNTSQTNENLLKNAYIDVWRDNAMDADIDLYSKGSGPEEKIYLGNQPVHYIINQNGDTYTYQNSSFENKMTGVRDPATIEYIKKISKSDLQQLENELKTIVENNSSNSSDWNSPYWFIKINNKSIRVNVDVKTQVIDKYF